MLTPSAGSDIIEYISTDGRPPAPRRNELLCFLKVLMSHFVMEAPQHCYSFLLRHDYPEAAIRASK